MTYISKSHNILQSQKNLSHISFTRCLNVGQYIRIPCLYCVQIGFIFPQLKVLLPPKIFKEEKSLLNFLWTGQCKSAESKEGRKSTLINRKKIKTKYCDTLGSTQMGKYVRGTWISCKYVNKCFVANDIQFLLYCQKVELQDQCMSILLQWRRKKTLFLSTQIGSHNSILFLHVSFLHWFLKKSAKQYLTFSLRASFSLELDEKIWNSTI